MHEKLLNNDETAINELWDLLLRYSYATWPDNKTVDFFREDYINEAIYIILDKLNDFEGRSKFSTWAITIFKNVVLMELRTKRGQVNQLEFEDEWVGFNKISDNGLLVDQLFNQVVPNIVSEENFHILVDYFMLGRNPEEICLDYNLTNANALYTRVFRTKKAIVDALGNNFPY